MSGTDPNNDSESSRASSTVPVRSRGRHLRRIARLARKELRESLRDRRTLATLIMMPLIVYPLLGSVVQKFAISRIDINAPAAAIVFDIRVDPELQSKFPEPVLEASTDDALGMTESAAGNSNTDTTKSPTPEAANLTDENTTNEGKLKDLTQQILNGQPPAGVNQADAPVRFERYSQPPGTDLEALVRDGSADVAVLEIPPTTDPTTGVLKPGELRIVSRRGDPFSARAASEAARQVADFRDDVIRSLLDRAQIGAAAMPFVSKVTIETSGPRESPLSAFVPLMLVLMTMTGAVYPAIDLTAGERERGTLEMLIAAPVSRRDLLIGKFIAVFSVAVLTAIINLTAMILTLYGTGFDRVILGEGASIGMFLQVLALLIVFASFFSAVLLSITSFARSFREAQAWLIPLMLISLAPGILSLMPGVRLTVGLSLLPLVNIVLLGKELFQGIASPVHFVITLLATSGYTVLALQIASRIFGSDMVLFAGNASVGGLKKRPQQTVSQVPLKLGIGGLAVLIPAFIVLAGLRGRLVAPENLSGQLALSGLITILLFAVFPLLLTTWNRVQFASGYAVRGFSPIALIGAILLGATLWTTMYETLLLAKGSSAWAKILSNPKLQELAQRLTSETPLLLRLISLSAIPALCEELFFRGFLMSALQGSSARWKFPLLMSTFLFAAFHVIVDQSLTLERFPATFLLGLVLGWIRLSTGSIIPGIAMHMVSNGLLLSLTELQPLLEKLGLDLAVKNETHLPLWFLIFAAACSGLGAWCVQRGSRSPLSGRLTVAISAAD